MATYATYLVYNWSYYGSDITRSARSKRMLAEQILGKDDLVRLMDKRYLKLPIALKQLISKVEGLEIETKETPSEEVLNQFSKSCASFANTQGGSIVIGVNQNGEIVGANIDQQIMDRISNEAASCRPPVKVQLNLYREEGKTVLQVLVPKSEYLHTDKSFRFPLRTGGVTSFMELGTVLAYAKERNLIGGESIRPIEKIERRKPDMDELKPFMEGLSHEDSRVRFYALANLFLLVFSTEIETERRLLLKLVKLLRDPDANVRKSALRFYELLSYYVSPSHKTTYNRKILPLAIEVAKHDDDKEVRKEALRILPATGDKKVIKIMVQLVASLPEDDYRTASAQNVWGSVVSSSSLGPEFRRELFKEFVSNNNVDVRRRIEEITQTRYPG